MWRWSGRALPWPIPVRKSRFQKWIPLEKWAQKVSSMGDSVVNLPNVAVVRPVGQIREFWVRKWIPIEKWVPGGSPTGGSEGVGWVSLVSRTWQVLYGWHFEQKLQIHKHPLIPFYGRYIDDICAIVYASTREEALTIMSQVKFDDCVIEWNASDQFQVFLDMTLYIDENRRLQYMPYRKARSHQERIPWISHHPLDVKRGTYYGEMSRLATISSTYSIYSNAIKSLAALYIARGYPEDIVLYWTKNNIREKWEKRLNETPQQHEAVLVLKS